MRTDLWVGMEADGSYECELDVVAYHPLRRHIVQIEPSFDLLTLEERERHFRPKFEAGRKYLHRLLGATGHAEIEQLALVVANRHERAHYIGGGVVVLLSEFIAQIIAALADIDPVSAPIPEHWALIRTVHFASHVGSGKLS